MLPLLLLISFLGTCGTVFYIFYKHKGDRKSSISLHVSASKQTHVIFAAGHFVGGLAFLIFVYKYFYIQHQSLTIFLTAVAGFLVEQVQAFIPDIPRFKKMHTVAAFGMAFFMTIILVLAPSIIKLTNGWLVAYICLGIILLAAGVYAMFNKQKFYQTQLLFFPAFYIFLLILLYGS